MLPKYIHCKWCGSPMHLVEQVCEDDTIRKGEEQLRDYYYDCNGCGAQSPNVYMVCTHEWAEYRLAVMCNILTVEEAELAYFSKMD